MPKEEWEEKMRAVADILKKKYNIDLKYNYIFDQMVYSFFKDKQKIASEISMEYLSDFPVDNIVERIVNASEGEKIYESTPATQSIVYPTSGTYNLSGMDVSGTSTTSYSVFKIIGNSGLYDKYKIRREKRPDEEQ